MGGSITQIVYGEGFQAIIRVIREDEKRGNRRQKTGDRRQETGKKHPPPALRATPASVGQGAS